MTKEKSYSINARAALRGYVEAGQEPPRIIMRLISEAIELIVVHSRPACLGCHHLVGFLKGRISRMSRRMKEDGWGQKHDGLGGGLGRAEPG